MKVFVPHHLAGWPASQPVRWCGTKTFTLSVSPILIITQSHCEITCAMGVTCKDHNSHGTNLALAIFSENAISTKNDCHSWINSLTMYLLPGDIFPPGMACTKLGNCCQCRYFDTLFQQHLENCRTVIFGVTRNSNGRRN